MPPLQVDASSPKRASQDDTRLRGESRGRSVPATSFFKLIYSFRDGALQVGVSRALGSGLASLGLPQGNVRKWDIRRMSLAAL
jgi:hypothetical protein